MFTLNTWIHKLKLYMSELWAYSYKEAPLCSMDLLTNSTTIYSCKPMKLIVFYCQKHWKNIDSCKTYLIRWRGEGGGTYHTCLKKKRWVFGTFSTFCHPLMRSIWLSVWKMFLLHWYMQVVVGSNLCLVSMSSNISLTLFHANRT